MDVLTFVDHLIGNILETVGKLGWPSVVAFLLWLIRRHLPSIADRIEDITFPGGAHIKIAKKLERASVLSQEVASPEVQRGPEPIPPNVAQLQLERDFPEAAIMTAFRDLEAVIKANEDLVSERGPRNITQAVSGLFHKEVITQQEYDLFRQVRDIRNQVVHAKKESVTPAEASEFSQISRKLISAFKSAFQNARKTTDEIRP